MNRFVLPVLLSAGALFAQVDTAWVRHHQYTASYSSQSMMVGRTMAMDPWGNVYLGAHGQYDSASTDIIILKYNRSGGLLWSNSFGAPGTSSNSCYGIAADGEGSVYATGSATVGSSGLMVVVKWDAAGNLVWARHLQGDTVSYYNRGSAIAAAGGAVYVAGQLFYRSTQSDFAVVKLDATTGDSVWTRRISRSVGTNQSEQAFDVAVGPNGNIFACGQTHDPLSASGSDASVVCYEPSGTQAWVQHFSSTTSTEMLRRLCVRDNLVAAAGYAYANLSSYDALLVAYTTAGTLAWSALYDNPSHGSDYAYDTGIDAAGNVFACGMSYTSTGSSDVLTLKYSTTGTLLWSRTYDSGAGADGSYALALDNSGNVVVGGYIALSTPPAQAAALKYSSGGDLGWVFSFVPPGSRASNYVTGVMTSGSDVYLGGMLYWRFPNYYDPTVIKLREIPDVGAHAIVAPLGTAAAGVPITPQADVRNYSLLPASFGCRFEVSDGYVDSTTVTLGSGASTTLSFSDWTPSLPGFWAVKCSTLSSFDYNRANDSACALVYVPGVTVDVGIRGLVAPAGNIRQQATVFPAARWHNFGTRTADFTAHMFIDRGATRIYAHNQEITGLRPDGRDTVLQFPGWVADQVGYYTMRCSTAMASDSCVANDTLSFEFGVMNLPNGEWQRMADLPAMPSGRPVSKGGATAGDGAGFYALKGNKTNEVHVFDVAVGSWRQLPDLPEGASQRPVGAGSAMAADGIGRLYVARGNKTTEFYRYDSMLGWKRLPDVPLGSSRKALKGGTGMEFALRADTGYVYLLKGTNTPEFYRYNAVTDTWVELPAAPAGTSSKPKYADGSGLACDGGNLLRCLKAKYNEVFSFDLLTGNWLQGQGDVPFTNSEGRKKKVKKGGALAWGDGRLAVIKGGNTSEFWRLDGADSTWREFSPVPAGDQARKVKDGGGLEFIQGAYYVLKGGKTAEFWRFTPATKDGPAVTSFRPGRRIRALHVTPNPARGSVLVTLANFPNGRCVLMLRDDVGRVRMTREVLAGERRIRLNTAELDPGVYFLTSTGVDCGVGAKLVLAK